MHDVAAATASAVSAKGWKETRFKKDVAVDDSAKNCSYMSSASVFRNFFSSDT